MDVLLREKADVSLIELRLNPTEHCYVASAIRDRLWFLAPIEVATRLMIPAELAFDALAALFVAESVAASSGVPWFVPSTKLPFPLLRPSRGAFEFTIRLDEAGSVWVLTMQQAVFLHRCALDATRAHEDAPFASTFGIPRWQGIQIATTLHEQIRRSGAPIPRWF
jgi:hypothetical protein